MRIQRLLTTVSTLLLEKPFNKTANDIVNPLICIHPPLITHLHSSTQTIIRLDDLSCSCAVLRVLYLHHVSVNLLLVNNIYSS